MDLFFFTFKMWRKLLSQRKFKGPWIFYFTIFIEYFIFNLNPEILLIFGFLFSTYILDLVPIKATHSWYLPQLEMKMVKIVMF